MRCYNVFVHGRLDWHHAGPNGDAHTPSPEGFYCNRYVLASGKEAATARAFRIVRSNVQDWLRKSGATLELLAEKVEVSPIYKVLVPIQGLTFYSGE
jgi:hypothetical protein